MHFSVIILAMLVALLSSFFLCRLKSSGRKLTFKQAYANHEIVFEFTAIFGLFLGILIDLLVGNSLGAKIMADVILVPVLAFLLVYPFISTTE